MNSRYLLAVLLFSTVLLTTSGLVNAVPFTQKDNEAKEEIITGLSNAVNNSYSQYKTITAEKHDNTTVVIYNQSEAPPPPPPTCPPNEFYNTTSKQCEPLPPNPPLCPEGQHYNQTTGHCEDNQTPPPPPPPPPVTDKPTVDFNHSKILRMAAVGDIDDNSGLVTQLNLAKKYHTQLLVVIGDYGYKSCPAVIDAIKAAGFNKDNAVIVEGNHDCAANTKAFNGWSTLYGNTNFPNINGKLSVFAIDGNSNFDCSSTQFSALKAKLQSSDAWYDIPAIHQPFVTGPSKHAPNGQFNCWNPLFSSNGVNLVLDAHNHNYQRFDINGITYLLSGTGTHDTGSSMYPISSSAKWNGFDCQKCFTGTNGISLIDFQIDNPSVRHIDGWFISNNDAVKDSFSK